MRYVIATCLVLGSGCDSEKHAAVARGTDAATNGAADASGADTGTGEDSFDVQAAKLVSQMTLDEKLAMMAGTGVEHGLWKTPGVTRLGIPGYAMTDGARGVWATQFGQDEEHATAFPVGMARGASFDEELEELVGQAIGQEARAWGANVILAPVVNLLHHPAWGRAQETYGEDPVHLGRMGVAFINGAQHHVFASPKHFAANDLENSRFTVNVTMDERTLQEVFLPPFHAAVDAGAGTIMSAYNSLNGAFCSQNHHLLTDILVGQWHFRGFVESDWYLATRGTAASVNAGLALEMPTARYFTPGKLRAVLDGQDGGAVAQPAIDDLVTRLVRGQLVLAARIDPTAPGLDVVGGAEHAALALEVAQKSITLLKNDGKLLPFPTSQVKKLAVVGTFASIARLGDDGSSKVVPGHAVTPIEGLRDRTKGVELELIDSDELDGAAEATVAAADAAVVVVGLTADDEGENVNLNGHPGDRKTLSLSAAHEALINAVVAQNPRTVVVIEAGSAITMEAWHANVPAIVMAWYPGQEGGDAIADVLFGNVNPSGRLPLTFPVSAAQLPPFDDTSDQVTYDYFHGYRYVEKNGETPLFPFGFGLSYTTYTLSDLSLSRTTMSPTESLDATVTATNTGSMAGDDVIELFVGYEGSAVPRSPHDLKGFARVHLEPGASATVTLPIRASDLAYYDTAKSAWTVEPLTYTAYVGSSLEDLAERATFSVK